MAFDDELRKAQEQAEQTVERYLPEIKASPGRLAEAMRYSILAGGKRVRPILLLQSYAMYGGCDDTLAGPFAAAIEMIHTSSLIHDDLPDIDNDDWRRGRKTTHAVYGPALGILSGDALLNYAYETAMKALDEPNDAGPQKSSDEHDDTDLQTGSDKYRERTARVASALRILMQKTGMYGMLGGQSLDVENEKNNVLSIDRDTLDFIYLHKTAALIEAPLMIGAVLAGAPETDVRTLEQVGRRAGLAFQIRDDVLDATETTEEIGKPAGSDEKNGKTTYVTLFGADGAAAEAERLTEEASAMMDSLPAAGGFLREYLIRLASRRK
ncbi:MAG: polyprenyl synthetase family protein [Lachnospiraceae bacterium]|nr:polyprenyl synthetase family protein [Lachnospiraceae bacterium]